MPSWRTSTASVFPPRALTADGHAAVTVASRFGTLTLIRQAEETEVQALLARDALATLTPLLMPTGQPRRRAGWPVELSAAVDAALRADPSRHARGPVGADWECVLHARRQEAAQTVAQLRVLGPELEAD